MVFIDKMREYSKALSELGFAPIIPSEDDWKEIKEADINYYKAKVSRDHFDKVTDKNTYAILVVNEPKHNVENYIGANTFAEIAFAFYFRKKIYVLNGIYKPYADELLAWGSQILNGDIYGIECVR